MVTPPPHLDLPGGVEDVGVSARQQRLGTVHAIDVPARRCRRDDRRDGGVALGPAGQTRRRQRGRRSTSGSTSGFAQASSGGKESLKTLGLDAASKRSIIITPLRPQFRPPAWKLVTWTRSIAERHAAPPVCWVAPSSDLTSGRSSRKLAARLLALSSPAPARVAPTAP